MGVITIPMLQGCYKNLVTWSMAKGKSVPGTQYLFPLGGLMKMMTLPKKRWMTRTEMGVHNPFVP